MLLFHILSNNYIVPRLYNFAFVLTVSSGVIFSTMGGASSYGLTAGRVNIFYAGRWGTICSDGFGFSDALGLCHIMTGSSSVLAYGPVGSDNLG